MHTTLSRAAALATLALATLAGGAVAQRRPASLPWLLVDATGGVSLRQTLVNTTLADVWSGSLRAGVPLHFGVEPWVAGALAHLKNQAACDAATVNCSAIERRLLVGASWLPGGRGGQRDARSPYVGLGLGAAWYRGNTDFAHSIVLGLPIGGGSALSPVIELRSESYRGFSNDMLIIAVGLRAGL